MASGSKWRALLLACALGVASCGSGSSIESPGGSGPTTPPGGGGGGPTGLTLPSGAPVTEVVTVDAANTAASNVTLNAVAGRVYEIRGRTDVGADGSATQNTLTIEPGVTLMFDSADDILVVNRGSRIVANGTANAPIILTSRADLQGNNDPAISSRQWGGLIVLGRAPIRGCNAAVPQGGATCENAIEGVTAATGRQALYGGATPTDNSGSLRFIQIRYPGAFLTSAAAGDDLNGLTLGGVGSGTVIDHVQVHNSGDDGIEVFGGTVNMKNIIITGALDDSLDYDEGWTGAVQYLVVRQSALVGGPDRMVEASNRRVSSTGDTLFTNPTISNFTMVGLPVNSANGAIRGIEMNATGGTPGSSGQYLNGVVTGSTTCLFADAANTTLVPTVRSTLFDCPGSYATAATTIINAGTNNSTATPNTLAGVLPGPNETARTAINPATVNPFFDSLATPYIGAFSPTETIAANWATGWSFQLFGASGCPTGTAENGTIAGLRRCVLAGTVGASGVPASLRLIAGNIYELSGRVDVGVDRGGDAASTTGVAASLTIDPGVTVFGKNSADMLIVNRGSQIFVNGTQSAPVIMTSIADVANPARANEAAASREWAGLIILGRGPIRGCNSAVAQGGVDCQNAIEGVTVATGRQALYGGATAADNSGRLAFLQIRYPGAFLTSAAAGDDLNGLTLGGVGSGTVIQNVQVHNSGDDGIEIFGGTVNLRRVIISGATDDSLDYDEGWRGNAQFGIVVQTVEVDRDRMVEASNRRVSSTGDTLFTRPQISNYTFVGLPTNLAAGTIRGVEMNATGGTPGSSGVLVNSVVTGSTTCLSTDAANSVAPNIPEFHSVLFDCPGSYSSTAPTGASILIAAGTNNSTATANTLASATVGGRPFINGANETARTVFNVTPLGTFFTSTTYIGAVQNSSDTWWQGWSCRLDATSC